MTARITTLDDYDVTCCRLGSDNAKPFLAIGVSNQGAAVVTFDVDSGKCLGRYEPGSTLGSNGVVTALAMDKTNSRIVAGCDLGIVRMWNAETAATATRFAREHKGSVLCLDYHPYSDFVASGSSDHAVRIWDTRDKKCMQNYRHQASPVTAIKFTPDGKCAASGCADGFVFIYDLVAGKVAPSYTSSPAANANGESSHTTPTISYHRSPVSAIAFHPTELVMAVASLDSLVTAWDMELQSMKFATRGGTKISFFDQTIHCVNLVSYRAVDVRTAKLQQPFGPTSDAEALQGSGFHDNGRVQTSTELAARIADIVAAKDCIVVAAITTSRVTVHQRKHFTSATATPPRVAPSLRVLDKPVIPSPKSVEPKAPIARESAPVAIIPLQPKLDTSDLDATEAAHPNVMGVLDNRIKQLRVVRGLYFREPSQAIQFLTDQAQDTTNCGAVVDVFYCLQHFQRCKEKLTIEHASSILNLVATMMQRHSQEHVILSGLRLARSVNARFRVRLDEGLRAAKVAVGVDLNMEARIRISKTTQSACDAVCAAASQFSLRTDTVGEEARCALLEMKR